MVALESMALSLAKTIFQKAAGAWIADRRTAEERKKELRELLKPGGFRRTAPEQRFLDEAVSDLKSFGRYEFRGLADGDRAAALFAVHNAFERADLTDRALFAVDLDAAKLASRLRAGQPRAKTDAGLSEAGGAFYDAALDRSSELYVRAVVQMPTFVGRSQAEVLSRLSGLPDQVADRLSDLPDQVAARVVNARREAQAAVADPDGGVTVAGRPLAEVTDPFDLEVHRPVQPEDAPPGLPVLPPYVPASRCQTAIRTTSSDRSPSAEPTASASVLCTVRLRSCGVRARMTSPNSGWPSRTRISGPASSVTSNPARSAASTSAVDTPDRASTPKASGSPKATSSPKSRTAVGRLPIRAWISSAS